MSVDYLRTWYGSITSFFGMLVKIKSVRRGQILSGALQGIGYFFPVFLAMIRIYELSTGLKVIFSRRSREEASLGAETFMTEENVDSP